MKKTDFLLCFPHPEIAPSIYKWPFLKEKKISRYTVDWLLIGPREKSA